MKRVIVILLLLLAVLLSACSQEPAGDAGIFRDETTPINVKVNQEFTIAVASNPASAYMWREEFDEKFFEIVSSTFEINEAARGTEAMLEQHFRFKARRKGQTEVELQLKSPDLRTVRDKEFTVNIR